MSSKDGLSTHIDKLVVFLFIGVFLISASALAYRYAKYTPCQDADFKHTALDYRAGQFVKFNAESEGAKEWEWDFGDNTEVSALEDPRHAFDKEGEYEVRLLVNNICKSVKTITIKPKLVLLDSTKYPVFDLPRSINVGEKLIVKDETVNASTWAWRFGETASVNSTTKEAEYVYDEPGLKTVSLIVNGDETYITKKKIDVIPIVIVDSHILDIVETPEEEIFIEMKDAPETGNVTLKDGPEEQAKPDIGTFISYAEFKTMVERIADEKITAGAFSDYLCDDLHIPVIARGKPTTFLEFCGNIRGKKIRKVKVVELAREDGSNCIKNITIEYKKSLL